MFSIHFGLTVYALRVGKSLLSCFFPSFFLRPYCVSAENPENLERQYLIKWTGWSHLHNTWESESSLRAVSAKGMKKIDNYVKRLREIEEWYSLFDVFFLSTVFY